MMFTTFAIAMLTWHASASCIPRNRPEPCKPVKGTFQIHQRNLFPESADWDPVHCKLYVGALYNASAIQYDPYTQEVKKIQFPGISGDTRYHVGGVDYDATSGSMYFAADYGNAFNLTNLGKDVHGPNHVIKYNTNKEKIDWIFDMAGFQDKIQKETGQFVAGFQDFAEDPQGNIYVLSSFGDAIAKITPDGKHVSVFYNPGLQDTSTPGIDGLVAVGNTLVVSDDRALGFLVFDMRVPHHATPRVVKPDRLPEGLTDFMCDGFVAPRKYNGTVGLCSHDFLNKTGGIGVYESKDGWQSVKYKGYINNDNKLTNGSTPTDTVAIGDSIFINEQFFAETPEPEETKDYFPFIDITDEVDQLVYSC